MVFLTKTKLVQHFADPCIYDLVCFVYIQLLMDKLEYKLGIVTYIYGRNHISMVVTTGRNHCRNRLVTSRLNEKRRPLTPRFYIQRSTYNVFIIV